MLIVGKPLGQLWATLQSRCWLPIKLTLLISCNQRRRSQHKDRLGEDTTTKCHRHQLGVKTWKRSGEQRINSALFKIQWRWSRTLNRVSNSWNRKILRRPVLQEVLNTRLCKIKRQTINWIFEKTPLTRFRMSIIRISVQIMLARLIHRVPVKLIKQVVQLQQLRMLKIIMHNL